MIQIRHIDLEDVYRPLVHGAVNRRHGDIRFAIGDCLGYVGEHAFLVMTGNPDLDRQRRALVPVPGYVDATLMVTGHGNGTVRRVNGHSPPAGYEPGYLIPRHRIAALAEPHQ